MKIPYLVIKLNSLYLFILVLLVNLYPIAQRQWLNLSLLEIDGINLYSNLYLISGLLFPIIIFIISNTNFLIYKFSENKINKNSINNLSIFVISNLLILSFLITNYIFVFIDLCLNINNSLYTTQSFNLFPRFLIFLTIILFLLFNNSKIFIKRFILFIYVFISLLIWLKLNNTLILDFNYFSKQLNFYSLFEIKDLNILNIIYLILIEITYYFWSYLSYKNNLSDWKVIKPKRIDFYPLLIMLIFYLFMTLYYSQLITS